MKISALVTALAPHLALDADTAKVTATVAALLAADKKAKDEAEEKATKEKGEKEAADKAAKDAKENAEAGNDADMDDLDAEDEDEPKMKPAKDKKAMDAAIDARVAEALAANDALHVARREVEPILGVVAYDSASQVYKAALDKLGVATDGIHASAYPALLKIAKDKSAAPALASDEKILTMSEAFKGFDRIRSR
jgi:uncharacterized protein